MSTILLLSSLHVLGLGHLAPDLDPLTINSTPTFLNQGSEFTKIDAQAEELLSDQCGDKTRAKRSMRKIVKGKIFGGMLMPTTFGIVRGKPVSENLLNYHWAVKISSNTECAGTLISPIHVVTAAHCVTNHGNSSSEFKRVDFSVSVGAKCMESTQECRDLGATRTIAKVKNVVVPSEVMKGENHRRGGDIALLELEKPIEQTDRIEFACLPAHDMDLPLNTPNFIHWGWGDREFHKSSATSAAVLNDLKDVSLFDCPKTKLDVDLMCTMPKLTVQGTGGGDSGSGLEYFERDFATGKHYVVGVLSYSPSNPESHTYCVDLRIYAKWICDLTGICYMVEK